jgi:hypothetical protein
MSITETVEEYLQRGGTITRVAEGAANAASVASSRYEAARPPRHTNRRKLADDDAPSKIDQHWQKIAPLLAQRFNRREIGERLGLSQSQVSRIILAKQPEARLREGVVGPKVGRSKRAATAVAQPAPAHDLTAVIEMLAQHAQRFESSAARVRQAIAVLQEQDRR